MIQFVNNMTHKGCLPGLQFRMYELGFNQKLAHMGYAEFENGTDPARLEQLRLVLEKDDMYMCPTIGGSAAELAMIEICKLFIRTDNNELLLPRVVGQKFNLEKYLKEVMPDYTYNEIRYDCSRLKLLPPHDFLMHKRWEWILLWMGKGMSMDETAERALLHNRQSLDDYFMHYAHCKPSEYQFPAAPHRLLKMLQFPCKLLQFAYLP